MQRTSLVRGGALPTIMHMPATERQVRNVNSNDALDIPVAEEIILHATEFDGHVLEEFGRDISGFVETSHHVLTNDQGAEERFQWASLDSGVIYQLEAAGVGKFVHSGAEVDKFVHNPIGGLEIGKLIGEYPHLDQSV
jgi:hypothetical protein